MNQEIIRISNLSVFYTRDRVVLEGLNYSFLEGKFYFLTGPSGIGKTTLFRIFYREILPSRGSVYVLGRDVLSLSKQEIPAFRYKIGIIFQDNLFFNHLTLLENIALPLVVYGGNQRGYEYAKELINWVGLYDYLDDYPDTLSSGQKQRAAVARAIITKPKLILADEPIGNVDEAGAYKIILLLQELNRLGTTVIMATHNRSFIGRFGHEEIALSGARLYSMPMARYA